MLPNGENQLRSSSFLCCFAMAIILMLSKAESRYMRPSDHGLMYQNNPTGMKSPEMKSFFGGPSTESEGRNSSKPWWKNTGAPGTFMRREDRRKDRVREVILISSFVCGIVGVGLMVAVAFIYFYHRRRSSSQLQSSSSCKEIVVHTGS